VDRKIRVPRPNQAGASDIFRIYLKDKPMHNGKKGNGNGMAELAESLAERIYDDKNAIYAVTHPNHGVLGQFKYRNLVSGAMIKGIVDRASSYAIQREINGGARGICGADLSEAVLDELAEQAGFSQSLVRDDWEEVFGSKGREYQRAHSQGYLILENVLKDKIKSGGKIK
jgi:proteasome-associated ATPase